MSVGVRQNVGVDGSWFEEGDVNAVFCGDRGETLKETFQSKFRG